MARRARWTRSTTVYDSASQVIASLDPLNNRSTSIYDAAGQTVVTIDARGNRSTSVYDAAGQNTVSIDALAFRTTSLYDNAGQNTATTDARGNRSTSVYDNLGQLAAAINALADRTSFTYDAAGQQTATEDPLNHRNTNLYDAAGQVSASLDALANRTSITYDANGQQVAVTNPLGLSATTLYDAAGRNVAGVNALDDRTTTMYDAVGNTQALIDARSNRHSFVYDDADREIALIDPLSRRTTSGYDAAGNQTLRLDARGNRTTYAFDAASQLTARRYPDASRVTFAYDEVGSRTLMADSTGRYSWSYDAVNRTTRNQQPNNKTITYSWDAVGNRASMIDPDGGRFTYAYDAADRIDHLLNPQAERTSFSYDAASRRTLKKLANGTRASFTYDNASRLTVVANIDSASAYISRFDYNYDKAGNRTGVLESDSSLVTWTYDTANQLLGEHRTGTTPYRNTFTYDAAKNRLTKNEDGAVTTSTYDKANQLATSIDVTGTTTYTFDQSGNQQIVEAPNADRTTTTWNYENQPTKDALPTGTTNTATYQGDNLRTELQNSEGTKRFIWDGKQYLLQSDETNTTQAVWTNEHAEFTTLISQRRDAATQYPHFDALGSTRQLTNIGETVTDTWLDDAWGNPLTHTGVTVFPFQFVGMFGYFTDPATGTIYIVLRNYEPALSRWNSAESITHLPSHPRYSYADNNPIGLFDPSGDIPLPSIHQHLPLYCPPVNILALAPSGNYVCSRGTSGVVPVTPGKRHIVADPRRLPRFARIYSQKRTFEKTGIWSETKNGPCCVGDYSVTVGFLRCFRRPLLACPLDKTEPDRSNPVNFKLSTLVQMRITSRKCIVRGTLVPKPSVYYWSHCSLIPGVLASTPDLCLTPRRFLDDIDFTSFDIEICRFIARFPIGDESTNPGRSRICPTFLDIQ